MYQQQLLKVLPEAVNRYINPMLGLKGAPQSEINKARQQFIEGTRPVHYETDIGITFTSQLFRDWDNSSKRVHLLERDILMGIAPTKEQTLFYCSNPHPVLEHTTIEPQVIILPSGVSVIVGKLCTQDLEDKFGGKEGMYRTPLSNLLLQHEINHVFKNISLNNVSVTEGIFVLILDDDFHPVDTMEILMCTPDGINILSSKENFVPNQEHTVLIHTTAVSLLNYVYALHNPKTVIKDVKHKLRHRVKVGRQNVQVGKTVHANTSTINIDTQDLTRIRTLGTQPSTKIHVDVCQHDRRPTTSPRWVRRSTLKLEETILDTKPRTGKPGESLYLVNRPRKGCVVNAHMPRKPKGDSTVKVVVAKKYGA